MGVLVQILAIGGIFAASAWAQSTMLLATSLSPLIQNEQADEQGLVRVKSEETLRKFIKTRALVAVPSRTQTYYLKGVPQRYSYLRPWSKTFLDRLGSQHYAKFHRPLRVTSLVRTAGLQTRLAGHNGNAAPATGRNQSSHLTGATLDISKARMSPTERSWMRAQIVTLSRKGVLYGIEEHRQPTFHIMVYKNYAPASAKMRLAKASQSTKVRSGRSKATLRKAHRAVRKVIRHKAKQRA